MQKSKIKMQNENSKFKIIKSKLPGIQKNISLSKHTTFKIGGPAKYFFVAKTKEDLILAIKVAKKFNLPFFILGGGSNLLVSDKGFDGLVIKVKSQKSKVKSKSQKSKIIEVEAGISLSQLVAVAFKNSLTGLEWAIGIPGTVGGAIYGNAGAFGKSISDITKTVTVLEIKNQKSKIKNLTNRDCKFSYRNSIFKKNRNLIILSAILELEKGNEKEIKEKIRDYLNYRKETQPLNYPSAGSIFQNPKLKIKSRVPQNRKRRGSLNFVHLTPFASLGQMRRSPSDHQKLLREFPEIEEFNKKRLIPAGWLIEKCGLKGKRIGDAKISEKHANFIINLGKAKAKDVIKLIKLIKKRVKEKFGVILEEEIQYLGF